MTENMVIKELLDQPFCVRPLLAKLRILNKGRPAPPLPNVITHHKTMTEQYIRHFCFSQYEKVVWVAECAATNKLYFWPCLLFFLTNLKYGMKQGLCTQNHKTTFPLSTVKIIWKTIKC
jgi:hypothetical protein